MTHLLIFGLGYTATRIAEAMRTRGWHVTATGSAGDIAFGDRAAVLAALGEATHVLSSVPPDRASGGDPVLDAYGDVLKGRELFYLSSTGVYGDRAGAWVDEATPTIAQSGEGRRNARAEADLAWLTMGARVFRLPGIYGPGRSALDRVREGKARRIDLPGQVFSRVHVDDIVSGVVAALTQASPAGAYNLGDDLPCSGNEVTEHACRLTRAGAAAVGDAGGRQPLRNGARVLHGEPPGRQWQGQAGAGVGAAVSYLCRGACGTVVAVHTKAQRHKDVMLGPKGILHNQGRQAKRLRRATALFVPLWLCVNPLTSSALTAAPAPCRPAPAPCRLPTARPT